MGDVNDYSYLNAGFIVSLQQVGMSDHTVIIRQGLAGYSNS